MIRFVSLVALLCGTMLRAADPSAEIEQRVAALVAEPQVTVVHFWAPWCGNCSAEMTPGGWAKFVADNPAVKVVFLNVWHGGDNPAPRLAAAQLGGQPNLILLNHPNGARREAERVNQFLGLPLTWLPTTWIFRAGKLRVAFNYGEVRFPVLQQMVEDAQASW